MPKEAKALSLKTHRKIDTELRKMNVPGINNKKIKAKMLTTLSKKLLIAKPLEDVLKTTYTQIYHRTKIELNQQPYGIL